VVIEFLLEDASFEAYWTPTKILMERVAPK